MRGCHLYDEGTDHLVRECEPGKTESKRTAMFVVRFANIALSMENLKGGETTFSRTRKTKDN